MEESGHSASNNSGSSHNVGRLGNLIRDNEEFFELISSTFLSERRYSISVQAAATRLLFSCSLTWMYPHVFEDTVLENLKSWTMDDTTRLSGDDHYWKHETGDRRSSDSEMLKAYSTGLLAVCLASGGQVVEDVLTSGLPAKVMRYLRIRILGETTTSQRDATALLDGKASSTGTGVRAREECRSRLRQVAESSHLDITRVAEDGFHGDQVMDKDRDRSASRHIRGDERWTDEEPPDSMAVDEDSYQPDVDGEERWHIRDLREGKAKPGNRSLREEDHDENARDDLSRRRVNRGWTRHRGRGRVTEGVPENEAALTSPGSTNRLGGQSRNRNLIRNQESIRAPDSKKNLSRTNVDGFVMERDENDECFLECKFGSKDITDLVKKAVRAAETEAKAANAPIEAIKAAGDAAAEVVKSAAYEEFKKTNDDEAAVLAASKAASTVIDAGIAVEASRSAIPEGESQDIKATTQEANEDVDEFFILDSDSLAKLREKFCIQCLVILGEYVEVLGPVLHEKGVDVCIALLQRNSKHKEGGKISLLLPDVLKLICALAAHRKFAAVFVDRGGMQKLLAVPRAPQTFCGLSSCLFAIGSIQGIMERVCALPSNIIHQVVEVALQLLECPQDQARKNAALFFAAAFVFRAVLDAFDAQDGLQKMLNLLHDAAAVRSGVSSGALTASGSLRSDRSPPEVLTASEKQIAYHTCVALRQYFRAHLLLLADSIRPNRSVRSAARNIPSVRAAYKPLDISNEAMDAVYRLIQKDRKLGPAFVRARWPVVDKFLSSNGHITMLELCQAPPVERYLHDLLQYALGVLHIVTLVPYSRKLIVNATLSNDRVGIAVILDAANSVGYVEPEIVEAALNVLVCLVCPPPSISNKPSVSTQAQQTIANQCANVPGGETRERNPERSETRDRNAERFIPDRAVNVSSQNENRERNAESTIPDRGSAAVPGTSAVSGTSQAPVSTVASGLVGERRISLGVGAGCAGLAAQLEQGYRQAREAVRANNGIKVLLQLLQPRIVTPPAAIDCLRALACRVLLGLARDDTIAHILTKLQVGKKLSELIRDSGNQTPSSEQNRWQAELAQVAIELIGVVTNSGRASSLAATDAATPTLRRIERAAIAAATPITYHARELLLLIHEHLQATGLTDTATMLLQEAQLTPLPSLAAPSSLAHQTSGQETSSVQIQWPSGRAPRGFMSVKPKLSSLDEDSEQKSESILCSSKRKPLAFSSARNQSSKTLPAETSPVTSGCRFSARKCVTPTATAETPSLSSIKSGGDPDIMFKTPIVLPMKRKLTDQKEGASVPLGKRLNTGEHAIRSPVCFTPNAVRRSGLQSDPNVPSTPNSTVREIHNRPGSSTFPTEGDDNLCNNGMLTPMVSSSQHGLLSDIQPLNAERLTLDSVVVQYLKHQHRQCPAPITTLPPLSLLHPHVCPEPKRSLDAPSNVTSRLSTREYRSLNGGTHGRRKDRQFVYSRFRPWRTCRDDAGVLLTCVSFMGDSSQIAAGTHSGELKIFDSNSNSILESFTSHQAPLTLLQSYLSGETQMLLSSSAHDVRLWDATSVSAGPRHSFEGCKAARFSNSGTTFAALSAEPSRREILLYDVQTCQVDLTLTDTSSIPSGRGHMYSLVHFSPSDNMLLWNGVLWDRRGSGPIHRFDQFTDYGGGGFHPAGNEVIINSEVWDLRNFRLLRSVPSLDQTVITFNASGDVIYAILRRNLEDVMSAFQTRRVKHPLFAAFRTVDAVNYSDIATIPVDRCVLDFATEPTDSFVGLVTMDDQDEMYSSARVYEIGRRRPTDDDSDPDDAESEEDEEDDDDIDEEAILGTDLDGDGESDADDMSNDDDSVSELDDEDDEDGDFIVDGVDFGGGAGILEIVTDGEDDDSELVESFSSGDDDDDLL
ncbi:PREDICTED: DDB1- and CUL4-associated factor homolog 1-like [Nicotiana attenuata]|uniref:Ddb1- and cul4-associated factor -like 1 n=1 Tax=Nicotiana attenuata TaxID=49451 RepID=A0A314L4L6_NICAT|nr:PREDICTED: DDB1- and CUL4-associated factor homolog 1-like [Nicotiana attenuata]OIT36019.1 ddb1- and cul4-associated factor -like 1 [Nicotiana attenuata]